MAFRDSVTLIRRVTAVHLDRHALLKANHRSWSPLSEIVLLIASNCFLVVLATTCPWWKVAPIVFPFLFRPGFGCRSTCRCRYIQMSHIIWPLPYNGTRGTPDSLTLVGTWDSGVHRIIDTCGHLGLSGTPIHGHFWEFGTRGYTVSVTLVGTWGSGYIEPLALLEFGALFYTESWDSVASLGVNSSGTRSAPGTYSKSRNFGARSERKQCCCKKMRMSAQQRAKKRDFGPPSSTTNP